MTAGRRLRPGEVVPDEHITCIDCGGRCHLLSHPPEDGFRDGHYVVYRCEECLDRWDLVLGDPDDA